MIIKLAALGALGYAGYRYLQKSDSRPQQQQRTPQIALAGGPLSSEATVQSDPSIPPVTH